MKSIKASLVLGLLPGFVLLLGAGGWFLDRSIRAALVARFDAQLRSEAMTILSFTKQERQDVDVEFTDRYLREYDDEVSTRFFQVTRIGGKVEDRSESLGRNERLPQRFGPEESPLFFDFDLPNGAPGRAIGFEFVPRSEGRDRRHHDPNLKLGLVVAADRRPLDETLGSIRSSLVGVGLLSSLGALFIVGASVGLALRPVRRFTTRIEAIDVNALGTRLDHHTLPAELRPIARSLNGLLGRLDRSFDREKQFSADVAHELRTPIAELRSLSEVALKWPQADAGTTEAFRDSLGIARQMDGIVSSLLAIRRAEIGKKSIAVTKVLVREVVDDVWRALEKNAELRQVSCSVQVPPEALLETDRHLFGLILQNLLGNAVQYSPRRGSIRLLFEIRASQFNLSIANPTHDLTRDDVPHLFERFWRKETARSGQDHSGLGLSLARAYAQSLDCELSAALVGNDIVFTLTGPVSFSAVPLDSAAMPP